MKSTLINYNYDPLWLNNYPELDVTLYDRSDDGIQRGLQKYGAVYKTANRGDVDYDKLTWIVEYYDNLPAVFLWSKTNIHKFVDDETFKKALQANIFAPLLKKDHRTYSDQLGIVSQYIGTKYGPIYAERADSWFFHAGLDNSGQFRSWEDWARTFQLPLESYIPFAPGGSYILTRDRVLNHSRDLYDAMRSTLPYAQRPVEAHCCERSYYYLWR